MCAHEVTKQSGFRVTYGPVRAQDIPSFMKAERKANTAMRRVQFPLLDRLAVVPVEVVGSTKKALIVACVFGLIACARQGGSGFWQTLGSQGLPAALWVLAGYGAVSVLTPALLPWLPGRAFSVKGAGTGLLVWLVLGLSGVYPQTSDTLVWLLLFMSMGSFMGLNLTGASTYTSLSGVKKETRLSIPWMVAGLLLSVGIWLWSCLRTG
jgi:acetyl-CoA decarbonylase/synthase complex subunit gamma